MAMSDPIADMFTRIRNGGMAKFKSVDIPGSEIKIDLSNVLKQEGYIKNFSVMDDSGHKFLRVYLKYDMNNKHAICSIVRISKPSRRVYSKSDKIKPVLNGLGIAILTTSKGIITDKTARRLNVGGEVICNIW